MERDAGVVRLELGLEDVLAVGDFVELPGLGLEGGEDGGKRHLDRIYRILQNFGTMGERFLDRIHKIYRIFLWVLIL